MNFLHAVGNNDRSNGGIGRGDLVCIIVLLAYLHGIIRVVQTECECSNVENSLVVGNDYLTAKTLVCNQSSIFDNELTVDGDLNTGT